MNNIKLLIKNSLFGYCDTAEPWQFGIQDPATPVAEGMIFFHNYLNFFLIFIGSFVFWLLYIVIIKFNSDTNPVSKKFTHSSTLEIVWTIVPALILVAIAIPSFSLLYSIDEIIDPQITLKIVGHQWYWSYEYSDYATLEGGDNLNFDSYMVATNELSNGQFRLLEVDNRVMLPINTHIRLLITAADVLHSWAIPSFGIKVDACPGRLSQASLFIKREGVYYGQCSEICGVNHGFMPIVVTGVVMEEFVSWILVKMGINVKNLDPKPEINTETKPEINTETKPEINTETKPEINAETKPEINAETKPEINTETKPEINAETKPEINTQIIELKN